MSNHCSLLDILFLTCINRFVCAVSGENRELEVQFSSYPRPWEANRALFDSIKIWEAARATSAATSFFEPIAIGPNGQIFLDGATGSNNPVRKLWQEAKTVWHNSQTSPDDQVQVLVSIGTGTPSVGPSGRDIAAIGLTLVKMATETEQTANAFQKEHEELDSQGRYYRFNVLRGLETVKLEDRKSRNVIATQTQAYGSSGSMQKDLRNFERLLGASDEYRHTISYKNIIAKGKERRSIDMDMYSLCISCLSPYQY
jgi:predicted acylesterase/phospholipase RssA